MKMGQKPLKDKNKKASRFFDVSKDSTRAAGKIVQLIVSGSSSGGGGSSRDASGGSGSSSGTVLAQAHSDNNNFYCGGDPSKGKYALCVTLKGPTKNVMGKYRLNRCRSRIRSPTSASSRISSSRNTRSPSTGIAGRRHARRQPSAGDRDCRGARHRRPRRRRRAAAGPGFHRPRRLVGKSRRRRHLECVGHRLEALAAEAFEVSNRCSRSAAARCSAFSPTSAGAFNRSSTIVSRRGSRHRRRASTGNASMR